MNKFENYKTMNTKYELRCFTVHILINNNNN